MTDSRAGSYFLPLHHRLLLCGLYLLAALVWIVPIAEAMVLQVLQWTVAAAYISCGLLWLLASSWRRLTQLSAWVVLFSVPLVLLLVFARPLYGLCLLALSVLFFSLAGWSSYLRQLPIAGIPILPCTWKLSLKIALDEAMLGYFVSTAGTPAPRRIPGIAAEVLRALETMGKLGWLGSPAAFHQAVHAPEVFEIEDRIASGHRYQALSFASGYVSHSELPGAERWESYLATHTVHARIFQHEGEPRPWLMCVHGYRMGRPYIDFQLFSPGWLHHKLGFNLIMPLLPLHGLRKIGLRSGDGYFDGELLDLLHAEGQALNDLRSCLHWLHENREVPRLGIYGVSLGGLNASLLSCLEADIDSMIAGIPLVDPARVFELNASTRLLQGLQQSGIGMSEIRSLLAPVSPLQMPCKVAPGARAIVAGAHDKIVPLEPVNALQAHWGGCPLFWYQGTHLSVRRERDVRGWMERIWKTHGMLGHL